MPYRDRLRRLFSKKEIEAAVERLAKEISRDFHGEEIVLVCLLKGSFIFTADLARKLHNPIRIDFMRVSSYGLSKESSGEIRIMKDLEEAIEGKNVVIVEDIVDSGATLQRIREILLQRRPKSLKICVLIDKKARRKVDVPLDYVGFTMEDGFVVGYGIDYAEQYRHLPHIYVIEE